MERHGLINTIRKGKAMRKKKKVEHHKHHSLTKNEEQITMFFCTTFPNFNLLSGVNFCRKFGWDSHIFIRKNLKNNTTD